MGGFPDLSEVAFERSETQPTFYLPESISSRKLPRENLLVLESTIAVISECLVVTNITTLSLNVTRLRLNAIMLSLKVTTLSLNNYNINHQHHKIKA